MVCGGLSLGFGLLCDALFFERIRDREALFLPVFKALEYLCGIAVGYAWLRLVDWIGLARPWWFFVIASHSLVAGYRDARSDFGGAVMGPTVSETFRFVDAAVPLLALVLYAAIPERVTREHTPDAA